MAEFFQIEDVVRSRGIGKHTVQESEWTRWEKVYPDIVSSLVFIYKETNNLRELEAILTEWIKRNPIDSNAKDILSDIQN